MCDFSPTPSPHHAADSRSARNKSPLLTVKANGVILMSNGAGKRPLNSLSGRRIRSMVCFGKKMLARIILVMTWKAKLHDLRGGPSVAWTMSESTKWRPMS